MSARGAIFLCLTAGFAGLTAPLWNPYTSRIDDVQPSFGAWIILAIMAGVWCFVLVDIALRRRR